MARKRERERERKRLEIYVNGLTALHSNRHTFALLINSTWRRF